MINIQRITKTGIGIDNKREVNGIADNRCMLRQLVQTDKTQIRHTQIGIGQAGTTQVNRLKIQIGNNPGAERVGCTGHKQGPAFCK